MARISVDQRLIDAAQVEPPKPLARQMTNVSCCDDGDEAMGLTELLAAADFALRMGWAHH